MCVIILSFHLLKRWLVVSIYLLNSTIILTNVGLHVAVVKVVLSKQSNIKVTLARRKTDRKVTLRIVCLIFTTTCCWAVLGTVGMLQMAGVSFSKIILAGSVTFVLPVSTILNPSLNVFTTREFISSVQQKFK